MDLPDPHSHFDLDADLLDLTINEPKSSIFNDHTLIEKIISDKSVKFKAIKAILLHSWDFGTPVRLSHLDRNLFSCAFESSQVRDKVLATCPWSIKGHLIILQTWSPDLALEELTFNFSPFWVQIHSIPLNRMNHENVVRFGNYIGSFMHTDNGPSTPQVRRYLRIHVQVDI